MRAAGFINCALLYVVLALTAVLSARAQTFDLLIRHGLIVDGSGRPPSEGSVAIKAGRIAAIGQIEGTALEVVDARGCVLAPGFIDVHTHPEGILEQPSAENFIRMGITAVVAGNCGASVLNVADFFRSLEETRVALNVATLIGHNAVRSEIMRETNTQAATEIELTRMKGLVEQAMKDGALGFSTGLIYSPGKYAPIEEIIELAKTAAKHQGIYATHVRNEQEGLLGSLEEAFRVGTGANIPVQISHLKLSGDLISPQGPETIRRLENLRENDWIGKVIAALGAARQKGISVSQDLYAYSAATAAMERLLPAPIRAEPRASLAERLANPVDRERIAGQMKQELLSFGRTNYSHAVIVSARRFKALQGLTIPEAAQKKSGSNSLEAQIELVLDIIKNGGGSIILYEMNDDDLLPLLRLPDTMFASDSGTFRSESEMRHPRSYGSSARVLARYVREQKQISLEEAVRRMTSLPAARFKIKDRGELRKGAWADVVVFDPALVQDRATYAAPHVCATGFKRVFVNGVEAVKDDAYTGARAGRPIRRGE